jgi:hypothetical protein
MNATKSSVYGLLDSAEPLTLRYIGATSLSLERRLSRHINEAKRRPSRLAVSTWIRSLLDAGREPQIRVVHQYESRDDAFADEAELIRAFATVCPLVNLVEGGRHARASRLRMSRAHGGRAVLVDGVHRFESAQAAAEHFGINKRGISAVLRGRRRTFKGHTFKYADDTGQKP